MVTVPLMPEVTPRPASVLLDHEAGAAGYICPGSPPKVTVAPAGAVSRDRRHSRDAAARWREWLANMHSLLSCMQRATWRFPDETNCKRDGKRPRRTSRFCPAQAAAGSPEAAGHYRDVIMVCGFRPAGSWRKDAVVLADGGDRSHGQPRRWSRNYGVKVPLTGNPHPCPLP